MKTLFTKRVPITWFLLAAIVSGAAVIIWKLVVIDAPVSDSTYIVSDEPPATITPRPVLSNPLSQPTIGPQATEMAVFDTVPRAIDSPVPTATTRLIAVYVSGAVAAPGVYTLPEGSRVDNAVAAAGGALQDADLNRINMAARVRDEDHIIVYRQGEAVAPTVVAVGAATHTPRPGTPPTARLRAPTTAPSDQPAKPTPAVKINVNTATAVELEQIPGIGPALAQRIISDRETNGPFTSVEDLTRVNGIKEGVLAKLRPYVSVTP